jgi:molybdopterin biosynthesis enzyme
VSVRDGTTVVEPVSGQESHMIVRAATANALVYLARGEAALTPGSTVSFIRLP